LPEGCRRIEGKPIKTPRETRDTEEERGVLTLRREFGRRVEASW